MRNRWQDNDRVAISFGEDGVAQVRLVRADKLNAIDSAMLDSLLAAGAALYDWPGLRAVVLSGEGAGFCSGLDLSLMAGSGIGGSDLIGRSHGSANVFQQAALQWRKLPVPVIAAVHGVCMGGGLQIAAGADIRVIAPDARMAVLETKWGLVPDMGHFVLWRNLVREDLLRELTYTHREFSGEEAVELGFATHCDADPLARATAIAAQVAACSPHAIRAAKALFNRSADMNEAQLLQAESNEQARLLGSHNQREALQAGQERRAGDFTDP
ncbi:MAG: crotonase/enoyl-CoA hydratase family protein [Novosphingobium sp.]